MTRRPWKTGEVRRACEMRAAGMTVRDIAQHLDRPHGSVQDMLKRNGLIVRPYWTQDDDASVRETIASMARQLGRSECAVANRVYRLITRKTT